MYSGFPEYMFSKIPNPKIKNCRFTIYISDILQYINLQPYSSTVDIIKHVNIVLTFLRRWMILKAKFVNYWKLLSMEMFVTNGPKLLPC